MISMVEGEAYFEQSGKYDRTGEQEPLHQVASSVEESIACDECNGVWKSLYALDI